MVDELFIEFGYLYVNINIYFLCADVDVTYSSSIMVKDL